jgi:antitoxin VapB
MQTEQVVQLEWAGSQQMIPVPQELELESKEALIWREGNRLIIEPVNPSSLLALLMTLSPIEDEFPDVDTELLSLDNVVL